MSILLPKWRHSMSCRRRLCRRLEEISCQQGCPKRQDMSATSCRQFRDFFELKHLDWFELVAVIDINYSSPGSPYSSGAYYSWSPAALIVLSPVSCLSPVCQSAVTCLQVELMRMWAINGQTLTVRRQKYFLAHSPKIFSWRKQERRNGFWRHQLHTTYHRQLQKPEQSVFILLEFTPDTRQPLFFWRYTS